MKNNLLKRISFLLTSIAIIVSFAFIPPKPDEGMYPLSDIRKLNLNEKGLKISVDELYNPDGASLVDALVRLGGCTGSFVSPEGLIITNHHCVFGSVQRASTIENNYLENGFVAQTKEQEIPAEGLTARITVSYEDVSSEVLQAAENVDDISKRAKAISDKISEIVKREESKDSTIKAEVSEMFVGEQYVLFRYKMINDIRLVYVPPRSIGEFGGESDNWIWPRHTGDFSFVRAYVAPDGSPAKYSKDNVPFKPKRFLTVNPNGINEEDFVFILGYPGRTYKNMPARFVEYHYKYQLPYIQNLFSWLINLYTKRGENDPEFALKISSTIKGLANTEKNYRGKIQGIRNLDLINRKLEEEKNLLKFINSNQELKSKYGKLPDEINQLYDDVFESGRRLFVLNFLRNYVSYYRLADLFVDYKTEQLKDESERKSNYKESNKDKLIAEIENIYKNRKADLEPQIFMKIYGDASEFDELKNIEPFSSFRSVVNEEEYVNKLFANTFIADKERFIERLFDKDFTVENSNDDLIKIANQLYQLKNEEQKRQQIRDGKSNILLAQFNEVKRIWLNKNFIPDANSTLRLTFGYVRGYSPRDAVYYSPISSLKGMIEKSFEGGDYRIYEKIKEVYAKKDFGKFIHPKLNDVPVAFIYNTDTSGGNSGSPIMDAYGRLVGVNFDRCFEATINDYAWNETYSRSIGVDIRFVLWVVQKIGKADFLLKEMNINL
ncbi:S46 family peptidase [Ignavibacterium sp.]|uniref:S46 family peptidase n=1 Tax=Ignavibacterium sp. TaxID=2651167 RepID=UPI00220A10F1|nr:S46 family peptidase [Ignavibacterium sp.]BDQ02918.1 MAG: Asp/Glu-specific dipeptidyl-peptidase [Ignavibacterium sp.]